MDISADLEELGQTPVMVVCAGAKSILDLGLTLEYLETKGVPVIGYGTNELPAFYTRKSGFGVDYELDTPEELAAAFHAERELGMKNGMLVTNPIPEKYSMDHKVIDKAIEQALAEAKAQGIHGKETTPFLLAKVKDLTGGDSLESNIQLVYNNAKLAAATAVELSKLSQIIAYTHDVEEAVFLSSRILVVEESPITHLRSIDVPAEYPRSRDELRKPEILSLKEELIGMLRKETS